MKLLLQIALTAFVFFMIVPNFGFAKNIKLSVIHMDEKKHLKCINIVRFRNTKIRWHDEQGTDLSKHGTHKINIMTNSRKWVKSVLDLHMEKNNVYTCQVNKGTLKTVQAVISDKCEVVASPDDNVTLPCSFPFIKEPKGLSVVWKKNDEDQRLIVHRFKDGQDNLKDQDTQYTRRTEMSNDFSQGSVNLTLREVTFDDEGTFHCRAANKKGFGQKTVKLTIARKSEVVASPEDTVIKNEVVTSLYSTVTLRCTFPFIRGREGLSVVWEKNDQDGRKLNAHKFIDGQDNLKDQDISYTGRTELSKDFSHGTVDLTLREVTFHDEGTYYCRAANGRGHENKMVELTIDHLNANASTVTVIHIDGKKRLKCINIGVFRNPRIRWYDEQSTDLSEHGTLYITDISNGRKMVESVLNLDVETNKHYFCLLREGRLKKTARAVLSDEKPVAFPEIKLPE